MNFSSFVLPSDPHAFASSQFLESLAKCPPALLHSAAGSSQRVETGRALLTVPQLSATLFQLDSLIAVGGELVVLCGDTSDSPKPGRRTGTQVQHALSVIFPECYRLISNNSGRLLFRKIKDGRMAQHVLSSVSVGFITDGRSLGTIERNLKVLDAIRLQMSIEVLVAGPKEKLEAVKGGRDWVKLVGDYKHEDLRPPINRKKALIIDTAEGENLLLAHDRFFLDERFWERLAEFGNRFDFYNCRHCSLSDAPEERRVTGDYGYHLWPIDGYGPFARSATLPYECTNPSYYNNGGFYLGKRRWFQGSRWPRHLHWSDLEDVHFTRACELDGAVWLHDWKNRVFTATHRMRYVRKPRLDQKIRECLRCAVNWARFRLKNRSSEAN